MAHWPRCEIVPTRLDFSTIHCTAVQEDLRKNSTALFCKDSEDTWIETGTISGKSIQLKALQNDHDIQTYFKVAVGASKTEGEFTRFCFMKPSHGWASLDITLAGMEQLLLDLDTFPRFYKYLAALGSKTFARDEGFGGYDSRFQPSLYGVDVFESCYLLKYVEPKASLGSGLNPWSIRHALVYQKCDETARQSTYFFVRLPHQASEQFRKLLNKSRTNVVAPHWTVVQMICLQSVAGNWRQYINWLDEQITVLFDRLIIASVEVNKLSDFDSLSSSLRAMERLRHLTDHCLRTAHMLDINMCTIERMRRGVKRLADIERPQLSSQYSVFLEATDAVVADHQFLHKSITSLSTRANKLSDQLRDTISLRNSEINKHLVQLTNDGTSAMALLSRKAAYDAKVVKALTVVALIFVPASFAADFLQMGYITVEDAPGFQISAEKTLWMYAILGLPLVGFTLLVYFVCELANRDKAAKQWDEKYKEAHKSLV